MYLNINGIPMDFPLYGQDGELVSATPTTHNNDDDLKRAQCLLKIVRRIVDETEQVGTNLNYVSDDVNIYDDIGPDGNPTGEVYWSVTIGGGLNGSGLWSNYFKSLSDLLLRMEAEFEDAWIIDLVADCPDDVFDVVIGIRVFNNQLDSDSKE